MWWWESWTTSVLIPSRLTILSTHTVGKANNLVVVVVVSVATISNAPNTLMAAITPVFGTEGQPRCRSLEAHHPIHSHLGKPPTIHMATTIAAVVGTIHLGATTAHPHHIQNPQHLSGGWPPRWYGRYPPQQTTPRPAPGPRYEGTGTGLGWLSVAAQHPGGVPSIHPSGQGNHPP